jgi:pimeloyl-ACP methyl ester carboxylesterase
MMKSPDSIEVRKYGDSGPHVVLLHGGPGAPGEMIPVARHLSNSYRIIEPLQRGSGDIPLTVALHVEDLHNVLQEIPQGEKVRLVGFSWGAMLALTYAARHPEQIESVILIGCGTFDEQSRRIYIDNIARGMRSGEKQRIKKIEALFVLENDRGRRNKLFAELGSIYSRIQAFKPFGDCFDDALHFDKEGFKQTWSNAILLQKQNIQPAEFANIRAAVTMIHGKDDPHPGKLIYKSLARHIQNLRYFDLPRCGHKPWIEKYAKDDFYKLLFDCLK